MARHQPSAIPDADSTFTLERVVSSLNGLRAIVIGAGVGGLCVARSLALRGAEVAVFERSSSQERSQAGGMITVWWNATQALAELEFAQPVVEAGTIINQIDFSTERGRRIDPVAIPACLSEARIDVGRVVAALAGNQHVRVHQRRQVGGILHGGCGLADRRRRHVTRDVT